MKKFINTKLVGKDDVIIKDLGNKSFPSVAHMLGWFKENGFVQESEGRLATFVKTKKDGSYFYAVVIK